MPEVTTINRYCEATFGKQWCYIQHDAIYFSYPHEPNLKLRLVTYQGNNNGLGRRGIVYKEDGSPYRDTGMSLVTAIIVYGTQDTTIYIGGE